MRSMPQEPQQFYPERKQGLTLHIILLVILTIAMISAIWATTSWAQGSIFILIMVLIIALVVLIPVILYRAYALISARYILERDGLRLRWGLRTEDIPLTAIDWVRRANESGFSVQIPFLSFPGAILGEVKNEHLGIVDFMASDVNRLILVATNDKVFAISPSNPREFEIAFQRSFEMGSIFPIQSQSSKPATFLQSVARDKIARILVPANIGLTLMLWLVSGLVISNHSLLPLGFVGTAVSSEMVRSQQLLLIPILGLLVLVINIIAGLYFFRHQQYKLISYILWSGGVITPTLLLISMILLSISV